MTATVPFAWPRVEAQRRYSQGLYRLLWVWALLLISADLKSEVSGYVHWVVTAGILFFGLPQLLRARFAYDRPLFVAGAGMVVAVLLAAFNSANPLYDVAQALKLGLILLGALTFFVANPVYARPVLSAFVMSAALNCALLISGLAGYPGASQMALGRWGTWLNHPGSLWRSGLVVFVYGAYLVLSGTKRLWSIALFGISLLLMLADGSRTALLLLPLAILYVGWVSLVERGKKKLLIKIVVGTIAALMLGILFAVIGSQAGLSSDASPGGLSRIAELWSGFSNHGVSGLGASDPTRFNMLRDAMDAIDRHPIVGGGIGSTRTLTTEGLMVVHMSYLQVWADLGIVGILSYLGITWGWVFLAPRMLRRVRALREPRDRALYYNALFLLFAFSFTGLMHPLSTEWSEWIAFIVPLGMVQELARGPQPRSPQTRLGAEASS